MELRHGIIFIFFLHCVAIATAKTHAILITGGKDIALNYYAFYDAVKQMHSGLRQAGINRDDITTLYADGTNAINTIERPFLSSPIKKISVPLSFENDSYADIKLASSITNVAKVFDRLAKTVKDKDNVLIVLAGHGTSDKGMALWGNDWLTIREMEKQLQKLPKGINIQLVASFCYGGQFVKLTKPNTCIVSKTDAQNSGKSYAMRVPFITSISESIRRSAQKAQTFDLHNAFVTATFEDISDNKNHVSSIDYIIDKFKPEQRNEPIFKCSDKRSPIDLLIQEITEVSQFLAKGGQVRRIYYEAKLKTQLDSITQFLQEEKNAVSDWFRNKRGKELAELKEKWVAMTPEQREKARPEYSELARKVKEFDENQLKTLNKLTRESQRVIREMRFLKESSPQQFDEYLNARRCFEYGL